MMSQRAIAFITIIYLTISSPVYAEEEVISEETLRVAEDLQRLTEEYDGKTINLDKIYGLAGHLQLQIRSLIEDMAVEAVDYVRNSIRDTAQGFYSSMRDTTVLDVMHMMFDDVLGDTSGIFNQTLLESSLASSTNILQKPDSILSESSPLINIINQHAPLASNNGLNAPNRPGVLTSNQIFVFINNGSGIPDTGHAINVIDNVKPGTISLGTVSPPTVKPISANDNIATVAVINNNDLNTTPHQPSIDTYVPILDVSNNVDHATVATEKPIAVLSNTVTVETNGNTIQSSNIQKPGNFVGTPFTEKPHFETNIVGQKPGNDFSNNFVYSVIGGPRPGHHFTGGFHGFVKEEKAKTVDKPLTFNDILLKS